MSNTEPFLTATEHPFATYVRILGKGKKGSRSLSQAEARDAFGMVLRNEIEPVQLGAFLMLLRVKEETAEELAGFVEACRENMLAPPQGLTADLDWSSYAGKKHQHPWYILAMLLLAEAGYRVFIHGASGHTPGRLYTEHAMSAMGLPVAHTWEGVEQQLDKQRLSYLSLVNFCPALEAMIQLRPLLGLRSPVNTLTRMFNPLLAPASLQSIFHPAYASLHQEADQILGQASALVFKGESGEVEIKPQADTRMHLLHNNTLTTTTVERTRSERQDSVDQPGVEPLLQLWRGDASDSYGLDATLATTATALLLLRPELDWPSSRKLAADFWHDRDTSRLD